MSTYRNPNHPIPGILFTQPEGAYGGGGRMPSDRARDVNASAEMDQKDWAIMMIQVKARQLGVSTLTELAVAHRVQFWADVKSVQSLLPLCRCR